MHNVRSDARRYCVVASNALLSDSLYKVEAADCKSNPERRNTNCQDKSQTKTEGFSCVAVLEESPV